MKHFDEYRKIKSQRGLITEQQFIGPADAENIEVEIVGPKNNSMAIPATIPMKIKRQSEMEIDPVNDIVIEPNGTLEPEGENAPPPQAGLADKVTPDSLITKLLNFLAQLRIIHWNTEGYTEHMATGLTYSSFDEALDKFVEMYQGHNQRVKFCDCFNIRNKEDLKIDEWICNTLEALESLRSLIPQTELQNEVDEMSGIVSKFKYLMTLK